MSHSSRLRTYEKNMPAALREYSMAISARMLSFIQTKREMSSIHRILAKQSTSLFFFFINASFHTT